jgi:cyclopropane fatty-acyl-phospholipid synthase-like methyltransferase
MKSIPSKYYTKKYFLSECSGYKTFNKSSGQKLDLRLKTIFSKIPIKKNNKVLDIGCGRGELVFWAAKKGCKAYGVDYSKSAIEIANRAKEKLPEKIRNKCTFINKTIAKMNFKSKEFEIISLVEVIEHLYPKEQDLLFKKINEWLSDDGIVFIHTEPNKFFNDFTYKYYCYPVGATLVFLSNLILHHKYPNIISPQKIRTKLQKQLHINEQAYFKLQRLFKKHGFKGKIYSTGVTTIKPVYSWKDILFNLITYFYPFSNYFPFNIIWGNDYYAILTKKHN